MRPRPIAESESRSRQVRGLRSASPYFGVDHYCFGVARKHRGSPRKGYERGGADPRGKRDLRVARQCACDGGSVKGCGLEGGRAVCVECGVLRGW